MSYRRTHNIDNFHDIPPCSRDMKQVRKVSKDWKLGPGWKLRDAQKEATLDYPTFCAIICGIAKGLHKSVQPARDLSVALSFRFPAETFKTSSPSMKVLVVFFPVI